MNNDDMMTDHANEVMEFTHPDYPGEVFTITLDENGEVSLDDVLAVLPPERRQKVKDDAYYMFGISEKNPDGDEL